MIDERFGVTEETAVEPGPMVLEAGTRVRIMKAGREKLGEVVNPSATHAGEPSVTVRLYYRSRMRWKDSPVHVRPGEIVAIGWDGEA